MQAHKILPLALLSKAGGRLEGRTRFQKLAFLADQELEQKGIDPYEFIPYDYGPFTKELYDALEWLEDEGLIVENTDRTYGGDTRYDYRLTSEGRSSIEENLDPLHEKQEDELTGKEKDLLIIFEVAEEVADEYADAPISNLITYVYENYPEYAEESVLA